jgi:hypothetical protein
MPQFSRADGRLIALAFLAISLPSGQAMAQSHPAQLARLASPPPAGHAVPTHWVGPYSDYVELTISPVGKVITCSIRWSTLSAPLNASICSELRQDSFIPAVDESGTSVYGRIASTYSWSMEKPWSHPNSIQGPTVVDVDLSVDKLPSGAPTHPVSDISLTVGPDGKVERCDLNKSSGFPPLDAAACKVGPANFDIRAMKDETGNPVRSVQELIVGFGAYSKGVFKREPRYANLGDPGPYYPERALRNDISGYATVDCLASPEGNLTKCVVVEEEPADIGFGVTTLLMAHDRWMKVAPGVGGHVLLRVDFPPPVGGYQGPPGTRPRAAHTASPRQ